MPLHPGSGKEIIAKNIAKLIHEGYAQKQAIAIAMHNAGKKKKKGK